MNKKFGEMSIDDTINSGQVFLWEKIKQNWYGIDGENIFVIDDKTKKFRKNQEEFNFFRQNDNFEEIFPQLKRDKIVKNAIKNFPGIS